MELEMSDAVLHQRLRLGRCPVPRKEDCLGCMGEARVEAMAAVREEVAAGGTLTKFLACPSGTLTKSPST